MNKVSVYGGLGNQMFQYALSCVLNSKGVASRISFRDFFFYKHHNGFDLSRAFYLDLDAFGRLKLHVLNFGSAFWSLSIVQKILFKSFQLYSFLFENIKKEKKEFSFDEEIFNVSNSRLVGTWQSIKYFEGHEELLRDKFKFKDPLDSINKNLSEEIKNNNSVAVHIRRGDYTKSEWRNSHLVIDGPEYYLNAIRELTLELSNPVFYFFSDDIDWAKSNFKDSNFKFIEHNNNDKSYLDMYLMSLCSNFIIANSTFSWWAAWLASNPKKIVFVPKPWIKGLNTPEIYPDNWRTVKL
ncbi:alpha-1,2-fucosyltransferase [Algoriphagus sp. SE2]|uniref:alpha-1,2-fucosyltransferase n=1 Tax=Algoriphagus sp. SE2 TaxID=3141536 RepID=UPI0031CD78C8